MPVEFKPEANRRRRFLQQVELENVTLTTEQDATVDGVCVLLPANDSPTLLQEAPAENRDTITRLLATLPQTRVIERIVEGKWPQ